MVHGLRPRLRALRPHPGFLIAVAGALVLAGVSPARAIEGRLPAAVVAAIAALDPAAMPLPRTEVDGDRCRVTKSHPARVVGDFNGDGRRDYALYTRSRGSVGDSSYRARLVVFLAKASGDFDARIIHEWETDLPLPRKLELQRAGLVREIEVGPPREVRLRYPAITEIYCGEAAATYYWAPRSGTFKSMVTGD